MILSSWWANLSSHTRWLLLIPQPSKSHFCGRSPDRRAGSENDTLQFSAGTVWGDKSADTFHAVADSGVAVVKDYTAGKDFVQGINDRTSLKEILLSYAWNASSFYRHNALYDLVFSTFVEDSLPLSAKNSAPVIETVKHILKLALKQVPGYAPCTSEVAAPVTGFTKAILDVYRIRYFWPLFMQLANFDGNKPIYYSLQKHTFLHTIPQKNASNNKTIQELVVIKEIIDLFREKVLSHQLPISLKSTALYKMLKEVEFDFYHPHAQEGHGISSDIASLALDDTRFNKVVSKFPNTKNYQFPVKSIFFNGCIRVRPVNK